MPQAATAQVVPTTGFWNECHFPGMPLWPGVLQLKMIREMARRGVHWTRVKAEFRYALKPGDIIQPCFEWTPGSTVKCNLLKEGTKASTVEGDLTSEPQVTWRGAHVSASPVLGNEAIARLLPMIPPFRLVDELLANDPERTTTGRLTACPDWASARDKTGQAIWGQEALLEGANQVAALVMFQRLACLGQQDQIPVLMRLEGAFETGLPEADPYRATDVLVDVTDVKIQRRRVGTGQVRIYSLLDLAGQKPSQTTFYQGSVKAIFMLLPKAASTTA